MRWETMGRKSAASDSDEGPVTQQDCRKHACGLTLKSLGPLVCIGIFAMCMAERPELGRYINSSGQRIFEYEPSSGLFNAHRMKITWKVRKSSKMGSLFDNFQAVQNACL